MKTAQSIALPHRIFPRSSFGQTVVEDFRHNTYLSLMLLPLVAYYFIFHYVPIYAAQIAFQEQHSQPSKTVRPGPCRTNCS